MECRVERLQTELDRVLRRVAALQVELDLAEGKVPKTGVPHYNVIEDAAHAVGQRLSRLTQQMHAAELSARHDGGAKCPACGRRCETSLAARSVVSGDGQVDLSELKCHCPSCRRDFFPSA
jgi:hypothetical protein